MNRWQLRISGHAARAILALPPPVIARLAGKPVTRDGYTMDAQSQLSLRLAALAGRDSNKERAIADERLELEEMARALAPRADIARCEDVTLGVPARVYIPHNPRGGALVFVHGGGWVCGSLDSHDAPCRVLADKARAVVIALDYRLAPEHRFPAAVDDAVAGFRAVVENAARWGIDPKRIGIGGDSAGGNLSAVVAQECKRDVAFQLLVYPAVDLTMSHPSIETMASGGMLEKPDLVRHSTRYIGDHDRKDPRVSPLWAASLAGLPPAYVVTAGFDPLRDEGHAYADALAAAGVRVQRRCYGSLFHGFLNAAGGIRAAREALDEIGGVLAAALA